MNDAKVHSELPANIEIGLGGHLEGLRGRAEPKTYEGDFRAQFEHLGELISAYDEQSTIQFLETRPPADRVEEFAEAAASFGMPVKQFTYLYVVGGSEDHPDALESLRINLEIARRARTVDRLNMQVWGDNETPSVESLINFYLTAEAMAQDAGIELYTETHVDRFTYDPRRLVAVHEALLDRTGGRTGLRVCADLSHYVHQLGNTHFPNCEAIASGELNIDPRDPSNYVSRNIIATGLINYGHLRTAVPNDLPRGHGSIQYPVVDPKNDPRTTHLANGGMTEPWDAKKIAPWMIWYKEIFKYQIEHPGRPTARFSTEFIGDGVVNGPLGEYRTGAYSNLYQNIAMIAVARRMVGAESAVRR